MGKIINIKDNEYVSWLIVLKDRYKKSQIKAATKVNYELIKFNWELGKDIMRLKADSKWGSGFYAKLSSDLKNMFPNASCFSIRNLQYMKQFYCLFPMGGNYAPSWCANLFCPLESY